MTTYVERFTGRVEEYERYRLRYPAEVIRTLTARCGLQRHHFIADIGAGTGMLAELFLEHGNAVVAVEPNDQMRAACERLAAVWPGLTVKNATAEATGLGGASVDFVGVGRAMHWFDLDGALEEFRRILRPGGWVVMAANGRCQGAAKKQKELEQILMEHGIDYKHVKQRHRMHEKAAPRFLQESLVKEKIYGEQALTLEEFLGQVQSYSAAPLPGHAKYAGMQQALRDYFERWQAGGVLKMKTACYLTCGQFSTR
jgi:SAM-dependent methyltransferase